jgi:hypothetical protein
MEQDAILTLLYELLDSNGEFKARPDAVKCQDESIDVAKPRGLLSELILRQKQELRATEEEGAQQFRAEEQVRRDHEEEERRRRQVDELHLE